jgi:2-methylcitrate dehydratase PrpD
MNGDPPAARTIARFVAGLVPAHLPPVILERAGYLLFDYLGVTLAGARTDTAGAVWLAIGDLGGAGPALVLGRADTAAPPHAALANGTAAHCLEMDDTHHGGSIHLGATMFSAALAAAALVPCTGTGFLAAAVAGYEVGARVAMALDPRAHYARGFHPTGTCGAFGAAATAAHLLGLDEERTAWALGIAGSQAAGSMEFLAAGAWTKRVHPGWAAMAGLHAAALARRGVRGPETILDGRDGFLRAHSDAPAPERLTAGLGTDFEVLRTSIKPHACCRYEQAPIDALLALRAAHGLRPDEVADVTIGVLEAAVPIICEPRAAKLAPASVVDAQFSMPFGAAVALVHGRASPRQHGAGVLVDPAVRALMPRIRCVTDPALEAHFPREWPAWVRVRLRDGRELTDAVRHPRGDPENPLGWAELEAKAADLLTAAAPAPADAVAALSAAARGLHRAPDLHALVATLRPFAY